GVVDVRGEVGELGARLDAAEQILLALVVLVVADRGGVDAEGVEHVDRRLVVLHRGLEGGAANVVAGGEQERGPALGAHRLDLAGQRRGAAEGAVEVVEPHEGDLLTGLGGGRAERHDGAGDGEGGGAEGDGRTAEGSSDGTAMHGEAPGGGAAGWGTTWRGEGRTG